MGKAKNRRVQASKTVKRKSVSVGGPDAIGRAFIELRQGSRAQPHRDRTVYNRNDYRFDDSEW